MDFGGVLPAASAQEPPGVGVGLVPVRLRAGCRSRQPFQGRPRSAFRLGRGSLIGRIASAMPGCKGQTLLAHVAHEDGSLTCYRAGSSCARAKASAVWDGAACDLETVLRMPLRLALVASIGDATVSVTMPTEQMLGRLRGVGRPRCDFFSALREKIHCDQPEAPHSLMLECRSEEAARVLLDRLQKAGCIVQGLQRRYVLLDEIGSGSFGVVFKAEDLYTGQYVAIKVFVKEYEQRLMHPFLEASILKDSSHANVQEFYGLYEVTETELLDALGVGTPCTYAIVSEFLEGGDLLTYMQRSTRISESRARDLAKQLLSAVSHMHDGAFVHRDLKPDNILLTGSGDTIKLIDFGLSAMEEDLEAMRMKAGSPGYVAPEIFTGLTCKADCFSVGVILFILLTGKALFIGKSATEVLTNNLRGQANLGALQEVSAAAREVVLGLLRNSPRERLSAAEALSHPWFTPQPVRPPAPAERPSPRTVPALCKACHLQRLKVLPLREPLEPHGPAASSAASAAKPDLSARRRLDLRAQLPQGAEAACKWGGAADAARAPPAPPASARALPGLAGKDASPAPSAERLTARCARHQAPPCPGEPDVRTRTPTPPPVGAGPVCAWSRPCSDAQHRGSGSLDRFSFLEGRSSDVRAGAEAVFIKKMAIRKPTPWLEKPAVLRADPAQAGQAGARAGLAVVAPPSRPLPDRCRRPAGLHHHRNLRA